jgi:hypothetical protein
MITLKMIHWPLLIAAFVATASGASFRTDINPALQYSQAFLMTPDLSQADRDYLLNKEWQGQKLPDRFGALVARYDKAFGFVRHAAQATVPCDWGIDMTPGPFTLLPGLARNKAIAAAARLRAMWDLQQGQQAEARDDLLAAMVLARNCARDGTLIAVLVQIAMENILCRTVAENFHQFSPDTLKQLADGFEAAPARVTAAAAIGGEKTLCMDWMLGRIEELRKENPGNDAKVMTALQALLAEIVGANEGQPNRGDQPSLAEQVTKAAGGTSQGVVKLLEDEAPLYQKFATIMALPYREYEEQIKSFSAEIQSSSNPFVSAFFPAVEKSRTREFAILTELAMVRAAVEYKLHGEPGLKSVTDPCGQGPFGFQRFIFEGVDRGFQLKSAYDGRGFPEVMIFVEKNGPPFEVNGNHAGQPVPKSNK